MIEIRTMEMVRAIRDQFYEDTKDLSREELIAFVRRHAAQDYERSGDPAIGQVRGIRES